MTGIRAVKPKLSHAMRLRCPYCGETPLRKSGSWLDFGEGCTRCHYGYEREEGYFTGASWMINFTIAAFLGIFLGIYLLTRPEPMGGLTIAALINVAVVLGGYLAFPYGKALWMWLDHLIHPLNEDDQRRYEKQLSRPVTPS